MSEKDKGSLAYYLFTDNTATESPDTIDLQAILSLFSAVYHPMDTVKLRELFGFIPKWFVYIYILVYD